MKHFARFLFIALVHWACSAATAAEKPRVFAGWFDLFPRSQHLSPQYEQPVVKKMKEGETKYSQSVHFDAMTGLPRSFTATVARDPEFATMYSPDNLKKAAAKSFKIGTRTAWVWADEKKVIVPIGDDKAVIIELDAKSQAMPLVEYAKSLEYDRIEKALADPPRTDFSMTVQTFKALKKADSALGLYGWAGYAKSEPIGKKEDERFRSAYALPDGSKVEIVVARWKIESVVHESKDGKSVDLLK